MADSDGFPLAIIVFLCIFYSTVFIFAIVGNTWVIGNCYKTIRKKKYHTFTWFVANLACADLVFIFLTIFNIIGFFGFFSLASHARARKTLKPRFTDFFTDFEKKTDCFAVYYCDVKLTT